MRFKSADLGEENEEDEEVERKKASAFHGGKLQNGTVSGEEAMVVKKRH